jgi:predicted transcriptional regulator of viral defense system/very-short-patch-repair endonuclease
MLDIRSTRQLLQEGYTNAELAQLTKSGELDRIRRGAYGLSVDGSLDAVERQRRLVRATVPYLASDAIVSHASAAALHGLDLYATRLDRVQVTRPERSGGKARPLTNVHAAPLGDSEVVEIDGIALTTVARTVADLARALPFPSAVVTGDSALRNGLHLEELRTCLQGMRRWPGVVRARRVAMFIDGRSESAGESRSRASFVESAIAPPELQFEIHNDRGNLVGRVDFAWVDMRTVGEFDGKIKYGRLLAAADGRDAVYQEKLREDALRDLGWQVVRWTWSDLDRPTDIATRLRRAFTRAGAGASMSAP